MSSTEQVVAITGATGLIGSSLVDFLRARGYRLRVLSRRPLNFGPGVSHTQGDIRSPQAVEELLRGSDFVVHLAGIAHTSLKSSVVIQEAEEINIGGAKNVLRAAQKRAIRRVVLISSSAVYSAQQGLALNEDSPTAADSVYALTKVAVENEGLEAARTGPTEIVIARPCLTYGRGARGNLLSLMRAIHRNYYFHIGGCNPMRSFLSLGNAAKAITHLMLNGRNGCIYNVADKAPRSVVEFVNALSELMGVSKPFTIPLPLIRAAVYALTPLQLLGICSSFDKEALKKLTISSTLDTTALASSGFEWECDELQNQKEMVLSFLAKLA